MPAPGTPLEGDAGERRRRRATVLAAGLALLAACLVGALSPSGERRAATNGLPALGTFARARGGATVCQGGERIPAGTAAIRVAVGDRREGAPPLAVALTSGEAVLATGAGAARREGRFVVVPVAPVPQQDATGTTCVKLPQAVPATRYALRGVRTAPGEGAVADGAPLPGRMHVAYLTEPRSGWSFAATVVERIGFGHAWSGTSVALLAAALTLAAIALAAWQLVRVPRAAWVCALVAVLNATAWGILVPAFQVPDEPAHYAYAEHLAQHGRPPVSQPRDVRSTSEETALAALKFRAMTHNDEEGAIWTGELQEQAATLLATPADRADGNGSAREVGSEPPLFYALQALPYALADGGTVLDRLTLMRLLSALLAGATVLFTFLFLREALPAIPETWTVGALGVAFLPMFAFMSGGMNSDALLYAASAAFLYLLARGFRRGLTARLAVATGAAIGVGLMTKFNFLGLLPGAAVALVAMAARQERGLRLRTLRLPALALAVGLAPLLLEMALNAAVWDRPTVGAAASNYRTSELSLSLSGAASYLWQFYLVPLPGMTRHLGDWPFHELWVSGFVGRFGWLDTPFRPVVYDLALVPLTLLALLAARTLVAERRRLRARRAELLSFALLAVAFLGFVAVANYFVYLRYGDSTAQTRYLFPLLPLYGALLVLAARGAGRRRAPALGAAIVVLAIAHGVFAQLLVVARYYA